MTEHLEEIIAKIQAHLNEQSRTLEAATKQLEEEVTFRGGDIVETGKNIGTGHRC